MPAILFLLFCSETAGAAPRSPKPPETVTVLFSSTVQGEYEPCG
ncbi:MAG TPA: hypothetical protein VLS90_15995 [Thermodesulfobacteriota bacterium]|nr:hypothetical protein [Thermodesulfobacteriota bacterium]